MKPNFPDLVNFEYYASNEEPSLEGSSIISLQTIEHIFNTISKRDPLNNSLKSQQFSHMAKTLHNIESQTANRPVPLDRVHQLYLFAQKAMHQLASNPSRKLIKKTAYVTPNQLKTPRTKTMNWIAKQPGRNIREKSAGKRIRAEKTAFVVDTKENKVFFRVMKQIAKEFQSRLTFGIESGNYDNQSIDELRVKEMKQFLSTYKKVKYSELGDLDISKPVIEPNNRLISDKNYAPIWRLYNELNNRKFNIQKNGELMYQHFEDMAYVYVALLLNEYKSVRPIDFPIQVKEDGAYLKTHSYEKNEHVQFNYFYESKTETDELVRIKALQIGKQRVICERSNGEEFSIDASQFPSKSHFAKLRHEKWISLKTMEPASEATEETFFAQVKLTDSPKKISISQLKRNGVTYEVVTTKYFTFAIDETDEELQAHRGLPILLTINFDGMQKELHTYADMKGLNEIAQKLLEEVSAIAPLDDVKKDNEIDMEASVNKIAMDFTRNQTSLYVNDELINLENNYLIRYDHATENEHQLILPNRDYLYEFDKQQVNFFDSLDVENDDYKWNINYFTLLIQKLHASQQINPITPLLYLIPDNIDEFAQVDIKKALNICYKKNFPIWRSVAGALRGQHELPKETLSRIIVIDTQGPQMSVTQLKLVEKNNQQIFMHYPSYSVDNVLAKMLTMKHFCEQYVKLYTLKYKLSLSEQCKKNMVTSGMVERCIHQKEEELILQFELNEPFYLVFDQEIYTEVMNQWLNNYEQFLINLKSIFKEGSKATALFHLIDFEVDEVLLSQIHEKILNDLPTYSYTTAQLLETISNESVLEKLLNSTPIWYEYLPDLSLDVIKGGTYDSLQLIKDEYVGNTMGTEKIFEIQETLVLPALQTSYLFPLKRGGSLGGKINAVIKHPAFPLNKDIEVNLAIEYKYGYENSYHLVLHPVEQQASIKELEVQWVKEEKASKDVKVSGYLKVPAGNLTSEEILSGKKYLFDTLNKALEIKRVFKNNDIVRRGALNSLSRQLFQSVYTLRKLLRQDNQEVNQYLQAITKSEGYQYLLNIEEEIPSNIVKGKCEDVFRKLFDHAINFVCSFGEYVPRTYIDHVIQKAKNEAKYQNHLYALMYRNSSYPLAVKALEKYVYKNPRKAIRSLRDSVWRDEEILQNLYAHNYKILEHMYGEIKRELKVSIHKREISNIRYTRDCLEMLLAMLAIRTKPHFEFLQAGLPKALKLAKNIRDMESILYEKEERTTPTLLQLDLEKPAGLWKLSDIGYVLNAYLTGEVKENLISVRGINNEEN